MSGYTALVLAGGEGRRMGGPKALLCLEGTTLLERLVGRLAPGAAEVLVAAPAGMDLPPAGRRVFDREPGLGPLAGIEAGLLAASTPVLVVFAVDMPFADARLAARLADAAEGHEAAVARSGDRVHGTCAAYSTAAAGAFTAALDAGERRLGAVIARLDVAWVDDLDPRLLMNLNTPSDLEAL